MGRRSGRQAELDGSAIDAARWAALRKSMAVDVQPDLDDEDIRALREAEEEEERRQEEERRAWREAKAKEESGGGAEAGIGSVSLEAAGAEEGRGEQERCDVSEDEDYEEMMRQAEEEEERRQQAEREAFLASRAEE